MSMLKGGRGIEFGGSAVAPQSAIMKSDGLEGKLDGTGKRIPVSHEFMSVRRGRHVDFEVVDLQRSGKLRRGKRSGQVPVEGGAAVQHHGKQCWTAHQGSEGQPILKAGCGNRKTQRGGGR